MSARLTPEDLEAVDRTIGRNLRPATTIDAAVWIDKEGRVVRVRQDIHFASDADIHSTLTLSDFRSAVAMGAPVAK
ncbi:hypothetical protein [Streptomyces sp. LN704]|uniref:hypothetical protein n=1 Tax=unclassified Streptomyces TaxID=2593676 RepID=UPI003714F903